jgi:outer membrane protein TolC
MNGLTTVALALVLAQAPEQAQPQPPAEAPQPAPAEPAPVPVPVPEAKTGPVVTLDEALRIAGERNLDLKALAAQLDQADEISWKAWSNYLPQLFASGSYTRQKEIVIPGLGTFQAQDALAARVELTQTLFSPQLWFSIRGAHKTERASSLTIDNGQRDVLFGVARTYYNVASLKEAIGVSERLLEIARRQERDARVRYQAGALAKVGLIRAEIDRARAEQDLKRARNAYLSAKVALATLLDRDTAFEVEPPPEPVLPAADSEALVQQALRDRPDVQAARVQVEAEQANRNAAWGRYFPDVQAFGRYTWSNTTGITGEQGAWAGGVQAQWTILDGFLRESDIRERNARVVESQALADGAVLRARQEVEQALLDHDSARANAVKAREQRDLAAENLRLVDVAYRAGTATAVEQADATAQLRNAEITVVTETLNAQLAAVQVLRSIGAFHPRKR